VVTPKDEEDLKFIAGLDPEFVAASFIGTGSDVEKVRSELVKHGNPNIKIIAKLERPVALLNLDDIIRASDALMVARGDLGVEIDTWDVPMWQKDAIKRCNKENKPVIVATQMLESMIQNSRPTRAEASDVYNAVLDGADAVSEQPPVGCSVLNIST
jgi:pyruvate kinase